MATKSISADVQAANSKLAQFLRRQEEEEMILQIGKRKPKQAREERLPGGSGRWALDPDWKAPTPMVDRPRTVAGSTSFHFSYTTISKSGVPTVNGAPVEGTFGKSRSPALDHSKYIERDGAAEVSQGAEHAGYIERPEAVESIDPSGLMAEQHERSIAHIVNESPTDEEANLLGVEAVAPEGIPSVFSNISDDPFERQEFWRAVERMEATPRNHSIILEPDVGADWWASLATDTLLPTDFRNHALNVAEAYRQHLAQLTPDGPRQAFEAKPFRASTEKAGEIIAAAQRMPTYRDWAPPFEFKSGRGGRVQFRMVAELPHELTAEDRALIVQNFCDHLGSLEERRELDGTPYKTGMMYTAVIHAPDAHNDSRNYHLHVVAYDRPCSYLAEHGAWDFEVEERYNHKGQDRVRFPHRQEKIGVVSQGSSKTGKEQSGRDFIPGLRAKFAEINNAVLKTRGVRRRLDPRKYSEMGIDRTPTQHLGTKAAALEAIGVPTAVGQLNALAIWSDAERAIKRRATQTGKQFATTQSELNLLLRDATRAAPTHRLLAEFRSLVVERERLMQDIAKDREAIMIFDHTEAKAKSRAFRARQTCLQLMADIEAGRANRSTESMRPVIEDRWKSAQHHIEAIDSALAPHRDALARAARSIEQRERHIANVDRTISPVADILRRLIAAPTVASLDPAKKVETQKATAAPPTAVRGAQPCETACQISVAEDPAFEPAEIEPPTIAGFPITEPTIAPPAPRAIANEIDVAVLPEGLTPLRRLAPAENDEGAEQLIAEDLDTPLPIAASTDRKTEVVQCQVGGPLALDEEVEPKVGGFTNEPGPARRDLPKPVSRVEPSSSREAFREFDTLVSRIMRERIPIEPERRGSDQIVFTTPSLSPAEQAILSQPRFAHRTNQRLGAIHSHQMNEVQRVVRWIGSAGKDPSQLKLENRSASLASNVKQSVKTLFKHWGRHADVITALQAENDRRIELAKVRATKAAIPKVAQVHDDVERNARRLEASKLYPEAMHAFTKEVAEFITLLRDAAPEEDLKAAAKGIEASPRAREDITRHNIELVEAFERFLPSPHSQGITAGQGYGY